MKLILNVFSLATRRWVSSSRRFVQLWYIHLQGQKFQTHFKYVHVQQVLGIKITPNFSIKTNVILRTALFWNITQRR
jgi:hypothetical protein